MPKSGVPRKSPKVQTGVPELFSICPGLSGGPGESGFFRGLPASPSKDVSMKGNYLLNPSEILETIC